MSLRWTVYVAPNWPTKWPFFRIKVDLLSKSINAFSFLVPTFGGDYRLQLIFWQKLTHSAARCLCDSWATCYCHIGPYYNFENTELIAHCNQLSEYVVCKYISCFILHLLMIICSWCHMWCHRLFTVNQTITMVISKKTKWQNFNWKSLWNKRLWVHANFLNNFRRRKAVKTAWLSVSIVSDWYSKRIFKMRNQSSFSEVTVSCFRGL